MSTRSGSESTFSSLLRGSFVRYFIVGVLALGIHLAILTLLVELARLDPTVSTTIGFLVASVFNYALQYYWTFDATGKHASRFARYCAVTAITTGINSGIFWTLYDIFTLPYILAQIVTTGVIFLLNYEANRRFTFA